MRLLTRLWRAFHVEIAATHRRRAHDSKRAAGCLDTHELPSKWTVADAIAAAKAIEDGQKFAQAQRRLEHLAKTSPTLTVYMAGEYCATYGQN